MHSSVLYLNEIEIWRPRRSHGQLFIEAEIFNCQEFYLLYKVGFVRRCRAYLVLNLLLKVVCFKLHFENAQLKGQTPLFRLSMEATTPEYRIERRVARDKWQLSFLDFSAFN